MSVVATTIDYLKHPRLVLTTAESCTAGNRLSCLGLSYRARLQCIQSKGTLHGGREHVQLSAAMHALQWLPHFHQRAMAGEQG
ncbi:hypothetical protein SAMN05216202_2213 [Pseudomonas mucidolens]|uniref:Uncharacterized protein n=1 Tax=Pseudomonas mucidolens TaxID=46679 RepID=A0A1H2MQX3_9PSED|nr:hypothetical protein SAMN05216202_2213 [Pseudomonas mucidolens]SQH33393.1 competence/damage-inducible protein CinA C-terminal domain-containing protein [Pseudomonas mucidolens]